MHVFMSRTILPSVVAPTVPQIVWFTCNIDVEIHVKIKDFFLWNNVYFFQSKSTVSVYFFIKARLLIISCFANLPLADNDFLKKITFLVC